MNELKKWEDQLDRGCKKHYLTMILEVSGREEEEQGWVMLSQDLGPEHQRSFLGLRLLNFLTVVNGSID